MKYENIKDVNLLSGNLEKDRDGEKEADYNLKDFIPARGFWTYPFVTTFRHSQPQTQCLSSFLCTYKYSTTLSGSSHYKHVHVHIFYALLYTLIAQYLDKEKL